MRFIPMCLTLALCGAAMGRNVELHNIDDKGMKSPISADMSALNKVGEPAKYRDQMMLRMLNNRKTSAYAAHNVKEKTLTKVELPESMAKIEEKVKPIPFEQPKVKPIPNELPKIKPVPLEEPKVKPVPLEEPKVKPVHIEEPKVKPVPIEEPKVKPVPIEEPKGKIIPSELPKVKAHSEIGVVKPIEDVKPKSQSKVDLLLNINPEEKSSAKINVKEAIKAAPIEIIPIKVAPKMGEENQIKTAEKLLVDHGDFKMVEEKMKNAEKSKVDHKNIKMVEEKKIKHVEKHKVDHKEEKLIEERVKNAKKVKVDDDSKNVDEKKVRDKVNDKIGSNEEISKVKNAKHEEEKARDVSSIKKLKKSHDHKDSKKELEKTSNQVVPESVSNLAAEAVASKSKNEDEDKKENKHRVKRDADDDSDNDESDEDDDDKDDD